jgi:pimeloyl-ACP methyl ester carboxylesterase
MVVDDFARLPSGGIISYRDTGAVDGAYRTFIFVHGVGSHKRAWDPLLDYVPPASRVITISVRGYGDSKPLSAEQLALKSPPSELHQQHTTDFLEFLEYVTTDLGVPTANGGGITVLFWSKGCSLALGLYYFPRKTDILNSVQSIIFYEPPAPAVFGQANDPTAIACLQTPSNEDPGLRFSKYAAGFFRNPREYLASKGKTPPVLEFYHSGVDDPAFRARSKIAAERENMPAKQNWYLVDTPEEREAAAKKAVENIAKSDLKSVGIMWGSEGPPASLLGSWLLEDWLLKAGRVAKTRQVEGGNHFIHWYRPKEFWTVVLELS